MAQSVRVEMTVRRLMPLKALLYESFRLFCHHSPPNSKRFPHQNQHDQEMLFCPHLGQHCQLEEAALGKYKPSGFRLNFCSNEKACSFSKQPLSRS